MTDSDDFVLFNGMKVAAGWPDRLKAAQEVTSYEIGGKVYLSRHPWAKEKWFKGGTEELLRIFREGDVKIGEFDPLASS